MWAQKGGGGVRVEEDTGLSMYDTKCHASALLPRPLCGYVVILKGV